MIKLTIRILMVIGRDTSIPILRLRGTGIISYDAEHVQYGRGSAAIGVPAWLSDGEPDPE